ncbi:MAG: MFS transporter, partial [Actinomycetota bacterium]
MKSIALDLTPLRRSRDYRLLWSSTFISETGRNITLLAVFAQVYKLTGSAAAVGLVGLIQLVPLVVSTIFGGPMIDRADRRKILLVTQFGLLGSSSLLLVGAIMGDPPLVLIYVAVAISALFGGIAGPTRSAMLPNLVQRSELANAIALNQVMWNTTMLIGPAIGGIVIAKSGFSWAYGLDVASYAATIIAAVKMKPMPPKPDGDPPSLGLRAVAESFRFLRKQKIILSTFGIDLVAMVFGMPRALFPILAVVQFNAGNEVAGLLLSAPAAGAILGAATSGWVKRVERQGLAVVVSVVVWGLGIAGFGLVGDRLWLALIMLAIAGWADVISAVFRSTIFQLLLPDSLRGRMSAVNILVVAGGPRLGDAEAG